MGSSSRTASRPIATHRPLPVVRRCRRSADATQPRPGGCPTTGATYSDTASEPSRRGPYARRRPLATIFARPAPRPHGICLDLAGILPDGRARCRSSCCWCCSSPRRRSPRTWRNGSTPPSGRSRACSARASPARSPCPRRRRACRTPSTRSRGTSSASPRRSARYTSTAPTRSAKAAGTSRSPTRTPASTRSTATTPTTSTTPTPSRSAASSSPSSSSASASTPPCTSSSSRGRTASRRTSR
jgi:hypothetical protein